MIAHHFGRPPSALISWCLLLFLLIGDGLLVEAAKKSRKKQSQCKQTVFNTKTTNYRAWKEQAIVCELLKNYDAAVQPTGRIPGTNEVGPTTILTSLHIRSISAISEKNMEFMAQFRFQQEWFDDRLKFSDRTEFRDFDVITLARDQRIWIPDTFFQNERNGWYHMLDQENKFVRIRSDGKVIYNRRLTLTLACQIDLLRYPMDMQMCLIDFASYAYTTVDIIYTWDRVPITDHDGANGILPNFDIQSFTNASCTSTTNTGTYSCLRVEIRLQRVFSFFLLQLYVPSSMLVAVSWVSYWIDWKSTAARVPLAIVTLLTMITQSHAVNSNLPPVSYTKAIDVWIGACVVFIFASLIEYAVVNYTGIREERRQMKRATMNRGRLQSCVLENEAAHMLALSKQFRRLDDFDVTSPHLIGSPTSVPTKSPDRLSLLRRRNKRHLTVYSNEEDVEIDSSTHRVTMRSPEPDWTVEDATELLRLTNRRRVELVKWCYALSTRGRAERIDIISRIVFPVAFGLFNIAYWSIYL